MTDDYEFDFSGSQGAEHAAEAMKQGSFEREIEFLQLDGSAAGKATGKDSIVLRFVTDSARRSEEPPNRYNLAWITIAGHYASTKAKPPYAREGQNWPTKMGAGCRKDPVFAKKYSEQCFICDSLNSKPSKRMWALAIERIEIKDPANGQVLGWADKTREIFDTDANGDLIVLGEEAGKKVYQKKTVPAWVLVSQGWRNFFQPLSGQVAYFQKQGGSGLLDGDWLITRTGTKNDDTSYTPIRIAEQQIPAENPWGLAGGTKYDLSLKLPDGKTLMEAIYPDMPDLRKVLSDRVSDDYFGRFFVPGWLPEGFDPTKVQQGGQQQAQTHGMVMGAVGAPGTPDTAATEEAPSSALDALKNRVMASSAPAATPAATPENQQS